jgi:hypothetical protein
LARQSTSIRSIADIEGFPATCFPRWQRRAISPAVGRIRHLRKSVLSSSAVLPAAPLRILDPQEAEERERTRQSWVDLWRAIACEVDADPLDETRDDGDETADSA